MLAGGVVDAVIGLHWGRYRLWSLGGGESDSGSVPAQFRGDERVSISSSIGLGDGFLEELSGSRDGVCWSSQESLDSSIAGSAMQDCIPKR